MLRQWTHIFAVVTGSPLINYYSITTNTHDMRNLWHIINYEIGFNHIKDLLTETGTRQRNLNTSEMLAKRTNLITDQRKREKKIAVTNFSRRWSDILPQKNYTHVCRCDE